MINVQLEMNTDDDLEIKCDGKSYCHYSENLVIEKEFKDLNELIVWLKFDIVLGEGKLKEFTKSWIESVCNALLNNETPLNSFGNHEFKINITPDKIYDIDLYRDGGSFEFSFRNKVYIVEIPLYALKQNGELITDLNLMNDILQTYFLSPDNEDKKFVKDRFLELRRYVKTFELLKSHINT